MITFSELTHNFNRAWKAWRGKLPTGPEYEAVLAAKRELDDFAPEETGAVDLYQLQGYMEFHDAWEMYERTAVVEDDFPSVMRQLDKAIAVMAAVS